MNTPRLPDYTTRKTYQLEYSQNNREAINARKRAWRAARKVTSKFKGEYPTSWTKEFRNSFREARGNKCERCTHSHDPENGYALTIHHLDNDKSNCREWNLAALCQRCHLHIQGKVEMRQTFMGEHSEWMKPHVAGMETEIQAGTWP